MMRKPAPGLFITGTDTDVGKTYVAAAIARALMATGRRVGIYKPAASGCRRAAGELISDDAQRLWEAAGRPGELAAVCPQRFEIPLAPHLAARAAGAELDSALLRSGLGYWLDRSDVVLVEGAGGLMSPLADDEYVADLALDFGWPLVVVAPNRIGAINQVLQTLIVAATFREGLTVAGVVLNHPTPPTADPSLESNRSQLERHALAPILGELGFGAAGFDPPIDWMGLARGAAPSTTASPRSEP